MRWVVGWMLVGVVALTGCSGDEAAPQEESAGETPSTSSPPTQEPAPEMSSTAPEPVSTEEFCGLVRDVTGDDAGARRTAALTILQRGLPDDLDGDAKQGLQVLLDHAADLGSVTDSWRLYRDLGKDDRADLRSFTWWVTKECGKGYLQDLLPSPDLPDWLKDPKLPDLG